ncbi:hypothetical protein CEXT_175111 [Caerostris extrusa]|uniref:Uncharacterized protein n=1 Tax=Caerostris extrusa TaxID=172846 RepID=A0AAV4MWS0_CAEEX|nr:hypothetical protein CEXT_175111 [Caerostris extrusa]
MSKSLGSGGNQRSFLSLRRERKSSLETFNESSRFPGDSIQRWMGLMYAVSKNVEGYHRHFSGNSRGPQKTGTVKKALLFDIRTVPIGSTQKEGKTWALLELCIGK